MDNEFKNAVRIRQETWLVRRYGHIEEVEEWDGRIKWRVTVQDLGRPPFIQQLFARKDSAEEFYLRLMRETALPQTIERSEDESVR